MVGVEILGGLVLLVLGGEALVRGAVGGARRLGVSPLLIGLTLVGFGTSTPELVTSVQAALAGAPGIAVGNVVGSNIANILLILGLAAALAPLRCQPEAFRRDGSVLAGSAILAAAALLAGELGRGLGLGLVGALGLYVVVTYRMERARPDAAAELHAEEAASLAPLPGRLGGLGPALALALVGIAATVMGARLLVGGAIALAAGLGVSEALIGLTLVALGTSLPELATALIAALRRHADLAFGNVVGSNIFNVLGILGVTAVVQPLPVPAEIAAFDLWVMLGATALLVAFALTGWRLSRGEGALFLAGYGAYLGWLARAAL